MTSLFYLSISLESKLLVHGFRMTSLFYEMENNPVMFETTSPSLCHIPTSMDPGTSGKRLQFASWKPWPFRRKFVDFPIFIAWWIFPVRFVTVYQRLHPNFIIILVCISMFYHLFFLNASWLFNIAMENHQF